MSIVRKILSFQLVSACFLFSLCSCSRDPVPENTGNIDPALASQYFREFDAMCNEDNGELWGLSFCGPILIVDPATRIAVGNRADTEKVLRPLGDLFAGPLPDEIGIANTAMDWDGTRWTMLIWWSLGGDSNERLRLMAHEAFHRLQPELGLTAFGEINAHLDTADGRFWLQMEWNALQKALLAEGAVRREAVTDALTFRELRRDLFPHAAEREIPLEIFEGLAEYAGMRLAGFSSEQLLEAVSNKRNTETGLVRSFAYVTGPLYGYLLDDSEVDWRERTSSETDLGALLSEVSHLSHVSIDEADRRAERYDAATLRAAETERERKRTEQLDAWRASLIEGPVLVLDLNAVSSGSFDPGRVFPFDENQTVYTTRRLIAEWGVLTVDEGAILENGNTGRAHVSLSGADADFTTGDGWTLELAEGWKVVAADRTGDVAVRRN